jgi:molybdate transport system substrate-binding protein
VAKVASGVVDAGVVYATDAHANQHITALPIPAADQPATVYPVALTAQGHGSAGARAFVAFLLSGEGQHILRAAGFAPPPSPSSSPSASPSPSP